MEKRIPFFSIVLMVVFSMFTQSVIADDSLFNSVQGSSFSLNSAIRYNKSNHSFYISINIPDKFCNRQRLRQQNNTEFIHVKGLGRYTTKTGYWREIKVFGEFKPYTDYPLIVEGRMCGMSGYYRTLVRTGGHASSVEFLSKGLYFSKVNPVLKYRHREVSNLKWKIYKIDPKLRHLFAKTERINYSKLQNSGKADITRKDSDYSRYLEDYPLEIVRELDKTYYRSRDWTYDSLDISQGFEKGQWYFFKSEYGNKLLQFTNLGLSYKVRGSRLWGQVIQLDTGKPTYAQLSLLKKNLEKVQEITVDADGYFELDSMPAHFDYFEVTKGKDSLLVPENLAEISTKGFSIEGEDSPLNESLKSFVYSDRGLYRLGETAHLTSIFREFGKSREELQKALNAKSLSAIIKGPGGTAQRTSFSVEMFKNNAVTWDWAIPEKISTGRYQVLLKDGPITLGKGAFSVEQIIPPTMEGKIVMNKDFVEWNKAERRLTPFNGKLNAKFLFGAPASKKPWEYKCILSKEHFAPIEFKGYEFNDSLRVFPKRVLYQSAKGPLDAEGNGNIDCSRSNDINQELLKQIPGHTRLTSLANVYEEGGRSIEIVESKPAYLFDAYPGVKSMFEGKIPYQQQAGFNLIVIDPITKKPKPHVRFTVQLLEKDYWGWYYLHDYSEAVVDSKLRRIAYMEKEFVSAKEPINFSVKVPRSGEWELLITVPETGVTARVPFKYGWSWSEESGVNKAASQKITLTPDKKQYLAGDKAEVLVTAPFDGKLLIAHEVKGREIKRESINVVNRKAVYKFEIEKAHGDWFDLTAILLRIPEENLKSGSASKSDKSLKKIEVETPYRALGLQPIKVIKKERQLKFSIQTPENVQPESEFSVKIQALNEEGQPHAKETWMTVAVVDEGILNLARFKTPDPYKGFHLKQRYKTEWYDTFGMVIPYSLHKGSSAFGSDAGFEKAMKAKRIIPMAWWSGIVKTNAVGQLDLKVPVNDYSGKVRVMVVGWSDQRTGSTKQSVPVFAPLDVKSSLPRVFGAFDKSTGVVEVFNNTEESLDVKLNVQAGGALALNSAQSEKEFSIEAKKSKTFEWGLSGLGVPGKGTVVFSAISGELQRTTKTELLVRPPGPQYTKSHVILLEEGKSQTLALPASWNPIPGSMAWTVTVSGSPVMKIGKHLRSLVSYPHGCAEQTTSRLISMILLKPVLGEGMLQDYLGDRSENIDGFISSGIDKLQKMQLGDGGFAYWKGGSYQYPWINAYVTHFLWLAKKMNHDVPNVMFTKALRKLKQEYYRGNYSDSMAYSGLVLALAGQLPRSDFPRLLKKLNLDSKRFNENSKADRIAIPFAETIARILGMEQQTRSLFINTPRAESTLEERFWWGRPYFMYGESSMASRLFAESVQSDQKKSAQMLSFLDRLAQKRYLSTHTAAWTLLALNEIFGSEEKKGLVRIEQNGEKVKEVGTGTESNFAEGRFGIHGSQELTIHHVDRGSNKVAFGLVRMSAWPKTAPTKGYSNNIQLERSYYSESGNMIVPPFSSDQGSRIFVKLSASHGLAYSKEIENVALEDWVPAGFELENPRLMSGDAVSLPANLAKLPLIKTQNIDYLDDKINIFGTLIHQKRYFVYSMKAVSLGDYQLMPALAEAMYQPDIRAMYIQKGRAKVEKMGRKQLDRLKEHKERGGKKVFIGL